MRCPTAAILVGAPAGACTARAGAARDVAVNSQRFPRFNDVEDKAEGDPPKDEAN
jgi:hypothetical protein